MAKTPTPNQDPVEKYSQSGAETEYSPFDIPVVEKEYRKPKVSASFEEISAPIDEPTFEPIPLDLDSGGMDDGGGSKGGGGSQPQAEPSFFNPQMNDLNDREKNQASEQLADIILDGYEKLHELGNFAIQIKERKLKKLEKEGKISTSMQIPYDAEGNTISVQDFVDDYNQQVSTALKVEPEFKAEVKPPLVRVLAKKGAGMTDEAFLLTKFGMDLVPKMVIIGSILRSQKEMIEMWGEMYQGSNGEPVKPNPIPREQPKPEPQVQEEVVYREESIIEQMEAPVSGFAGNEFVTPNNMPQFGDPELLKHMENVATKTANKPVKNARKPRKK
jgi:hypothetical protein